ncbi:MAG: DUF488 domain-containing protein [Nitrospinota bacterium]
MGRDSKYMLYTIGYEGLNIDEFVERLVVYKISRLIDVREIPLSRKKGFSKTRLNERLEEEGIEYIHLKELGSPRDIRQKLKQDGDYAYFFRKFSKYLSTKQHIFEEVFDYLVDGISCLMCFEQLADKCHRSLVAENMKNLNSKNILVEDI